MLSISRKLGSSSTSRMRACTGGIEGTVEGYHTVGERSAERRMRA
jgi:hypothetical protein